MNLPFYIARHLYTGGQDKQKASQPAMRIAMLGIAIGMAVMIVSVAVVFGFKHTIRDKVVGFGSHIIVTNVDGSDDGPVAPDSCKRQSYEGLGQC